MDGEVDRCVCGNLMAWISDESWFDFNDLLKEGKWQPRIILDRVGKEREPGCATDTKEERWPEKRDYQYPMTRLAYTMRDMCGLLADEIGYKDTVTIKYHMDRGHQVEYSHAELGWSQWLDTRNPIIYGKNLHKLPDLLKEFIKEKKNHEPTA